MTVGSARTPIGQLSLVGWLSGIFGSGRLGPRAVEADLKTAWTALRPITLGGVARSAMPDIADASCIHGFVLVKRSRDRPSMLAGR
jgi:hypothetical protein